MAQFVITGTERASGKNVKVKVEGRDEAHARERAARHGVDVASCSPFIEPPSPLPPVAIAEPAQQAIVHRAVTPPAMPVQPAGVVRTERPFERFVLGQDATIVEKLYNQIAQLLTPGEEIMAIAVQKKPVLNVSPDAIAATSRRLIVYRSRMLGGMTMSDFIWSKLVDAKIQEGILGATLSYNVIGGPPVSIDHIPKDAARAIYRASQQQEEQMAHLRRERELEDKRAAAGGVQVNHLTQQPIAAPAQPAAAGGGDVAARLRNLKSLLSEGLISQADFDVRRDEILKSI